MHEKSASYRMDFAFYFLLLLIFGLAVFLSLDAQNLAYNCIILGASFIPFIFAYYSTISSAMTVCAVLVFIQTGISVVRAAVNGTGISIGTWFFMAWIPLMTVCVYNFTRSQILLRRDNEGLRKELAETDTFDRNTGLRNLRSFENDAEVYMNISRRYQMELMVLLLQVRYQQELSKITDIVEIVRRVSGEIQKSLRTEDVVYLISEDPYQFGILLFTDPQTVETIVTKRIRSNIAKLDFSDMAQGTKLTVELDAKAYRYDQTEKTSLALLNMAMMELKKQEAPPDGKEREE